MGRNLSQWRRYLLLGLSILSIFMALHWLNANLSPLLDSLGETNGSDCDTRGDFASVPNGVGMVATGHSKGCAVVLLSTAFTDYVYLHKVGESDSAKSLVFRFDEIPGSSDDLQIVWRDNSNLHISISEVSAVTKQVSSMNGVKISYSIGKEGYSLDEVQRVVRHVAEISFLWLIFGAGGCIRYLRRREARISLVEVLGVSAIWVAFTFIRFWLSG